MNDSIIPFNILDKDVNNYPAEQSIHIVKEHVRFLIQSLPFDCMSNAIICGCVFESASKLNHLPRTKGVSKTMSPATIVANAQKLDCIHLTLSFGDFVEVHEDNCFQTNFLNTRFTPSIT